MLSWLSPDGKLILLTTTLRSFAVGFVSVLLAYILRRLASMLAKWVRC